MVRVLARSTQLLVDLAVLAVAFALAFLIRFDWGLPDIYLKVAVFFLPYVVGFQFLMLMMFGVHRFAWRYVGLREVSRILAATGTSFFLLLIVRLLSAQFIETVSQARYGLLPAGVIAINFALAFLGISGVRVARRLWAEKIENRHRRSHSGLAVPTLLIGAGQAGVLVAKEIASRPDLGILPLAFLDDDRMKVGTVVHGLPVMGSTLDLKHIAHRLQARQVLITIADAPGNNIRRIKALADEVGLPAKIIPGIYEIVGGKVNLSRIRNVSIEDLLGREAVSLETTAIEEGIRGQTVFVSGAGGSIGSELCRQVCRFEPGKLVLLERSETGLFYIHRELAAEFPHLSGRILPCIADITDAGRIQALFEEYKPEVVYHAAAYKHVPMMECNPAEGVKNNVVGTQTLADAAHRFGARRFVMISTDKAVNPSSVMGATKRTAEIYIQSLSQQSNTRFVAVRFGNVLGSAGSVIPLFKEQIAQGGPVTVTHPEMKRYFMTIPEACQLVLQAGTMGQGGEIFILDMGEPVKIVDLARDLISLSGLTPGEDIDIQFTGIRPGEKLFEELLVADEFADKTRHPKIFVSRIRPHDIQALKAALHSLEAAARSGEGVTVRQALKVVVPEYAFTSTSGTGLRLVDSEKVA